MRLGIGQMRAWVIAAVAMAGLLPQVAIGDRYKCKVTAPCWRMDSGARYQNIPAGYVIDASLADEGCSHLITTSPKGVQVKTPSESFERVAEPVPSGAWRVTDKIDLTRFYSSLRKWKSLSALQSDRGDALYRGTSTSARSYLPGLAPTTPSYTGLYPLIGFSNGKSDDALNRDDRNYLERVEQYNRQKQQADENRRRNPNMLVFDPVVPSYSGSNRGISDTNYYLRQQQRADEARRKNPNMLVFDPVVPSYSGSNRGISDTNYYLRQQQRADEARRKNPNMLVFDPVVPSTTW